ncbi:hypothetical protein Hanom_Chr03g00211081 [Helianthus anomalus]
MIVFIYLWIKFAAFGRWLKEEKRAANLKKNIQRDTCVGSCDGAGDGGEGKVNRETLFGNPILKILTCSRTVTKQSFKHIQLIINHRNLFFSLNSSHFLPHTTPHNQHWAYPSP